MIPLLRNFEHAKVASKTSLGPDRRKRTSIAGSDSRKDLKGWALCIDPNSLQISNNFLTPVSPFIQVNNIYLIYDFQKRGRVGLHICDTLLHQAPDSIT